RSSRMMIDYLAGTRKYKKFAALYQDDEYGKSFLAAFEKDLGRFGLKLTAAESVKRGVTDVSAQIAKLHAARPEVTFLVLVPGPAAQALRERQKIGWTDTLMVSTGPLTDEKYLALATDAANGVEGLSLWPDPATSDLPGVKLYRAYMVKYFPKNEPNRYSLAGYFAGMLFTEAAVLAVDDLSISFGGLDALSGLGFRVAEREIFALIGPNGAGKSTVFNVITGLYRPSRGRVVLAGEDLLALAPHQVARRGVARTFQNTEVFRRLSALDNVLVGRHAHLRAGAIRAALGLGAVRREEAEARRFARTLLARFGL